MGLPKELKRQMIEQINLYDLIMLRSSCKSWFNLILDVRPFPKGFVLDQQACASYFSTIGSVSCLDYLKSLNFFFTADLLPSAVRSANVEVVKFLNENGCRVDYATAVEATRIGSLEILKYCLENCFPKNDLKQNSASALCYSAANRGQLHVLKYLHENGYEWDVNTLHIAALENNIECLKYALDNGCNPAWGYGHLGSIEAIQLYIEKDLPKDGWKVHACQSAVRTGDLPMLKFAHENGAPWDDSLMEAIRCGSLSCVQYILDNGDEIKKTVTSVGSVEVLKFLVEHTTARIDTAEIYPVATEYMQRDILEYLSSRSFPKPASLGLTAAETGNFEFFKWCIEEMKFDTDPIIRAYRDSFDIMQFALESTDYNFVKYVVANKLGPNVHSHDIYVAEFLPQCSDVRIWRLLYDMEPFEITDSLLHGAMARGTAELLEWFIERGAKFNDQHLVRTITAGNLAAMVFLLKQSCCKSLT